MSIETIKLLSYIILFISIIHFFAKNDEFSIMLVIFFMATGIMRYNAVLSGISKWVVVAYAFDIFDLNDEVALRAMNYFFIGTIIFVLSYFLFRDKYHESTFKYDDQRLFNEFLSQKQFQIIVLFIVFIIVNGIFNRILVQYQGVGIAFGVSYFYLFKLAIGGLILLFFLIFKNIPWANLPFKLGYLAVILFAAYTSYSPYERFQFLSWMIALGFIVVGNTAPQQKFKYYIVGGTLVLGAFAFAGNMRHDFVRNASFEKQIDYAIYRIEKAEDQNMLDGFMMVLQVYPQHLDYSYGMEHFEIFLRPIPRALWPEKPVGGYVNKLGLNNYMPGGVTVGISQSIYGTFYGEGGLGGIIIFSIIYGFIFARLFYFSTKFDSDMRFLFKGIIFASAVPILRGGDLPGIIAFVGMSYWPIFIFYYQYRNFLHQKAIQKQTENAENIIDNNPISNG